MTAHQGADYPFDRSSIYEIHVLGTVNPGMYCYLAGMTCDRIDMSHNPDRTATVLTGCLPDQAALSVVLNTLYDHGYTLTLVQRVEHDDAT